LRDEVLARWTVIVATSAAAVALGVMLLAIAHPWTLDDAAIVLVYARHLARGGEIYWNRSEGHVDGYTSFLDMGIKSAALALTDADPIVLAHALSVGFLVTAILAGGAIAFRSALPGNSARIAVAALGTLAFGANGALADGTSYLLETALYATVATLALYCVCFAPLERASYRAVLAASWILLALARPEGAPIAGVQAAAFIYRYRSRLSFAALVVPCLVFVGATAAYCGWHLAYFGWLAPNTYYAKASDSGWLELRDGTSYVAGYLRSHRASCAVAAASALVFVPVAWPDGPARARCATAAACAAISLAEVAFSGGDSYSAGSRFLAVPLLFFVAAATMVATGAQGWWRLVAAAPLVLFVCSEALPLRWRSQLVAERIASWPLSMRMYRCASKAESLLARHIGSIGETDNQAFKLLRDDLVVHDLTGLNDRAIAHTAWPRRNLWGKFNLTPASVRDGDDVLVLGPRMDIAEPAAHYSIERLVTDDELRERNFGISFTREVRNALAEHYVPLSVPVCGAFLNVLVRRELADRFADDDVLVGQSAAKD
jgi:hypothetical protein